MGLLLTEAAKLATQPLVAGVMNTLAINSPVLDRLPFERINGSSISYKEFGTLPGVEFRPLYGAYTSSTGTFNDGSEHVVILGGDCDIDNFIVATQGQNVNQMAVQVDMKLLAISYKFQDSFINGDTSVDGNSFDGLRKRTIGAQVIDAAPNGLPILGNGTTDPQVFFDMLDEMLARCPGCTPENSAFYAPASAISKINAAKRRLLMPTTTIDSFGKKVNEYNGIPIIDLGTKTPEGAPILAFNETIGTANNTCSIYLVRFGKNPAERGVTGLQANELRAYPLGELQEKPVSRTRIDWYPGLGVFSGRAVVRLRGILNQ